MLLCLTRATGACAVIKCPPPLPASHADAEEQQQTLLLGRQPGPGGVALNSPSVHGLLSRRHCRLRMVGGRLEVTDLASVNGTWVAKSPAGSSRGLTPPRVMRLAAHEPVLIDHGDTLWLGGLETVKANARQQHDAAATVPNPFCFLFCDTTTTSGCHDHDADADVATSAAAAQQWLQQQQAAGPSTAPPPPAAAEGRGSQDASNSAADTAAAPASSGPSRGLLTERQNLPARSPHRPVQQQAAAQCSPAAEGGTVAGVLPPAAKRQRVAAAAGKKQQQPQQQTTGARAPEAAVAPPHVPAGDAVPGQADEAAAAGVEREEPAPQQCSSSSGGAAPPAPPVTTAAAVGKRTIAADALDCIVCRELVVGAHALSCSHTACGACLLRWFEQQATPSCPTCRAVVTMPPVPLLFIDNAVSDLQLLSGSEPQRLAERREFWRAIKTDTEARWRAQFGWGGGGGSHARDASNSRRRRQQQQHNGGGSSDGPRLEVHLLAGLRQAAAAAAPEAGCQPTEQQQQQRGGRRHSGRSRRQQQQQQQHRGGGRQLGIDAFFD